MYIEFRTNGYWRHVQVHPKLVPYKSQPYQHVDHKRSCAKGNAYNMYIHTYVHSYVHIYVILVNKLNVVFTISSLLNISMNIYICT